MECPGCGYERNTRSGEGCGRAGGCHAVNEAENEAEALRAELAEARAENERLRAALSRLRANYADHRLEAKLIDEALARPTDHVPAYPGPSDACGFCGSLCIKGESCPERYRGLPCRPTGGPRDE